MNLEDLRNAKGVILHTIQQSSHHRLVQGSQFRLPQQQANHFKQNKTPPRTSLNRLTVRVRSAALDRALEGVKAFNTPRSNIEVLTVAHRSNIMQSVDTITHPEIRAITRSSLVGLAEQSKREEFVSSAIESSDKFYKPFSLGYLALNAEHLTNSQIGKVIMSGLSPDLTADSMPFLRGISLSSGHMTPMYYELVLDRVLLLVETQVKDKAVACLAPTAANVGQNSKAKLIEAVEKIKEPAWHSDAITGLGSVCDALTQQHINKTISQALDISSDLDRAKALSAQGNSFQKLTKRNQTRVIEGINNISDRATRAFGRSGLAGHLATRSTEHIILDAANIPTDGLRKNALVALARNSDRLNQHEVDGLIAATQLLPASMKLNVINLLAKRLSHESLDIAVAETIGFHSQWLRVQELSLLVNGRSL